MSGSDPSIPPAAGLIVPKPTGSSPPSTACSSSPGTQGPSHYGSVCFPGSSPSFPLACKCRLLLFPNMPTESPSLLWAASSACNVLPLETFHLSLMKPFLTCLSRYNVSSPGQNSGFVLPQSTHCAVLSNTCPCSIAFFQVKRSLKGG